MITHYDLFAGIGGFSLALEEVFDEPVRHIFCEWEPFCTAVLKKHWPDGEYWGDIADLVAHTDSKGLQRQDEREQTGFTSPGEPLAIVTGGFPCQPFSQAGRRRGTADNRYQWPNMFQVIRNIKPDWVIAENVRGLVTWSDGMVLETVCVDLESEGYEVQPFIIPAVAVDAPHRRDRVWIIASRNTNGKRLSGAQEINPTKAGQPPLRRTAGRYSDATNSGRQRWQSGRGEILRSEILRSEIQEPISKNRHYPDWERAWQDVAFATCHDGVDDGLPRWMDGITISAAKHRNERLKAMGNAIVPQVAMEVFKAIRKSYE